MPGLDCFGYRAKAEELPTADTSQCFQSGLEACTLSFGCACLISLDILLKAWQTSSSWSTCICFTDLSIQSMQRQSSDWTWSSYPSASLGYPNRHSVCAWLRLCNALDLLENLTGGTHDHSEKKTWQRSPKGPMMHTGYTAALGLQSCLRVW